MRRDHMKHIDLCHFSGTGNTLRVVQALTETLEKHGISVRLHPIETTDPHTLIVKDTLGLAFPVAIQSTYPFVWKFIRALPKNPGKGVFMVDTLAVFSGGIVGPLKDTVRRKGYTPLGAIEIPMPDNLFPKQDHPEKNAARIQRGLQKARLFAEELIESKAKWGKNGIWGYGMYAMYMAAIFFLLPPWQFLLKKVLFLNIRKEKCIQCDLCSKLCPIGNITPSDQKSTYPIIKYRCEACMRCIAYCPKNAIYAGSRRKSPWHYRGVKSAQILTHYRNHTSSAESEEQSNNSFRKENSRK